MNEKSDRQRLGETSERWVLQGRTAFQQASTLMAQQSTYRIDIFTYDLDKPLYDQIAFIDAIKALALHQRGISTRILIQNSQTVQSEGHRLIELARRLTSKIEIKRPHADYIDHAENFMIVDKTGYIRRKTADRYEGEANFSDRLGSKLLTEFFT
ncbi:MAG: acyltransferase, partial [Sedimenticola sp.]|nr:acyltransferase [Sedimenticola sp.]